MLNQLVHLGDLDLTMPLAAGIGSGLMASRAWRMALWWSLLFALAIGLVGATKIAFLGWGGVLSGLDFKALSGHATGVSAIVPTLLYLLLQRRSRTLRKAGVALGLALGAGMALLLVWLKHHTLSEALAGYGMGALVSLGAIRMADNVPPARPLHGLAGFGIVFLAATWAMQSAPVGYWMIRLALLLSGNHRPHAWNDA